MKKIGFIGTGVMGQSMVRNLMKAGYTLTVYNRTKAKADALVAEGATWADTPAQCAQGQDAVITIVGNPKDVEEVYFGEKGVFAGAKEGAYLIDMTTTQPMLSQRIYAKAKEMDLHAIDAPVSGGDIGAKNGTLSIMVGGEKEDFDACLPVLQAMGTNIIHTGGPGCGQHIKMANQIAGLGCLAGVCEAIAYTRAVGMDVDTMIQCVAPGASGSWHMTNTAPRIQKGDLGSGFYIKHYVKDLNIALAEAQAKGLELPMLEELLSMYKKLLEEGLGEQGTQSLIKCYETK